MRCFWVPKTGSALPVLALAFLWRAAYAPADMKHRYALGLGSNMRHSLYGAPPKVVEAAFDHLAQAPFQLEARAPILSTRPIGPSLRAYANAAAIITTDLMPDDVLTHLKILEQKFGRRSGGQRWRARVLDLDILLWSGGAYAAPGLIVPHIGLMHRHFVLDPLAHIAPDWRDPISGLSVRHLKARLDRKPPAA